MKLTARLSFAKIESLSCLLGALLLCGLCLHGCDAPSPTPAQPSAVAPATPESADLMQRAKDRSARGDTVGAIESYTQLLAKEPAELAALGNRAMLLAARGRNEEALQDYNSLLQIDAQNYPAINLRAALLSRMGQHRAALDDLLLIDVHRPDDPELLNRIAEAHMHTGDFTQALQAIDHALKLRRGWPQAIRNRAAIFYAMGDYTHAVQDYTYLLEQDPQDSEALNGVGLVAQFRDGDLVRAETHFRKSVLSNPYNAGAWYNIGYLEAQQGKIEQAKRDFSEAIRCDDKYADAYVNRGLLLMQEKAAEQALPDFETALALQPGNSHTKLLRGWARCVTGDRTWGCIDLAEAKAAQEPGVDELMAQFCNTGRVGVR